MIKSLMTFSGQNEKKYGLYDGTFDISCDHPQILEELSGRREISHFMPRSRGRARTNK